MPASSPESLPWWRNRRRLAIIGAVTALLLAGGGGLAYELLKRPGDVSNPDVPFRPEPPPQPPREATVNWPMFGYDRARTRYLPAQGLRPPFRRLWKYGDRPLLEFPPIYVNGRLYFVDNNGRAFALDAKTGRILWQREIGDKNASSPAFSRGRLFIVNLEPAQVMALNPRNGKTIWRRSLPGRSESSPLVIGNRVYFGCENGQLFAVNARNGRTQWATTLAGAVKAAPAYRNGKLYVGDYGGEMSAVDARSGRIVWQASAQGLSFGRSGAFYSTPAVAFGRVYAGNNDSRVYSFDARTGELAWTHSTGGYVYSGPTVADTANTPPSVYVGSFDGNVYALDARDGSTRWSASMGAQISGSLSIVGNTVYASTINDTTEGFHIRNGHRVWKRNTGAYTPVISDGRRIYLTGYSSITAYEPVRRDGGRGGGRGGNERR